jgi:phasin family protein
VRRSAASLLELRSPVRTVAQSGIQLTSVGQSLSRNLIELQTEIVSAAMAGAAQRLERAANAGSLAELVRGQVELLPATGDRVVTDARRSIRLFRAAGLEIRDVAAQTYRQIVDPPQPAATPRARRARAPRKRATRRRKAG